MKKLGSTMLCAALLTLCAHAAGETGHMTSSSGPAVLRPNALERGLTPAEIDRHPGVKRARALVQWMAIRSDHTQDWLRDARRRGRTKTAVCLDDLLSQLHAVENRANEQRERIIRLKRADRRALIGDHMVRLFNFSERSKVLFADVTACISEKSTRVRMPTSYRVKPTTPPLPPMPAAKSWSGRDVVRPRPMEARLRAQIGWLRR